MNTNRKLPNRSGILQPKNATPGPPVTQTRTPIKAPPVYRPQPVPKVLQRRTALPNVKTPGGINNHPPIRPPQTTTVRNAALQPKARALPPPAPKPIPKPTPPPIATASRLPPKAKTPAAASPRTVQRQISPALRSAGAARPSRVIQREPLAEVRVRGVTHLRRSNNGLSLASGEDYAEVRYPATVTIDLGDAWQSRLGMNLAVSPDARHTWYRVVQHEGRPVREDVYIREGMFEEVGRPPVPMDRVTVIRFCNVNDPTTLWSHRSKGAGQSVVGPWATAGITTPHVLARANRHMDGGIDDSPFVSVALDEQSLLRSGFSGGLEDIVFGADHPEHRAPHVAIFSVPSQSLISPDMIRQRLPQARQLIGLSRADKETERLYYGDDIRDHMIRYKNNPYRREHMDQIIRELTAEPSGPVFIPEEPEVPSLDMGKIRRDWATFLPILQRFLARIGRQVGDYPRLNAASSALALRQIFRQIEAAIEAISGLNQEWGQATRAFR